MTSSLATFAIWAMAVVVESLNCNCTLPAGTPGSSKLPDDSTRDETLVPTTETFIPVGAEAPAP